MSAELKEKLDQLGRTIEDMQKANDERLNAIEAKGKADPLLEERVDKTNDAITALQKEVDELIKKLNRKAFSGGDGDPDRAEYKQAFDRWFRKGVDEGLADLERKAMSASSDPDGGFLVPDEVSTAIDRVVGTMSAIRRLATVMPIGADTYKKLVVISGAAAGWVGEKAARDETTTPKLAEIAINTKELYANPAVTQKALDDSFISIESLITDEVASAFADQESDAFVNGNGVEQPKGILAYDTITNASYAWGKIGYVASGAATTFTNAEKLVDLQHALKASYRAGAVWLMNDTTQAHVRKFKDGEGNYLWRAGLEAGAPNTLLGKPVEIDDNMPDIGGNAYPIAFADFRRGYLVVDRIGIRVLRDPYTNKPYVHFYTTKRVGGGVVMYEAIKLLKVAST